MLHLVAFAAATVVAVTSGGIHSVDFDNFTYPGDLLGDMTVKVPLTLHRGEFQYDDKQDLTKYDCGHDKIAYGDLTGDGNAEAAVPLWCTAGGTGWFTEAYVYTMKNGAASLMGKLMGGDRGDHGIFRVRIVNQRLLVVRGDVTEGVCCPEKFAETSYKWNGKSFVSTGIRHLTGTPDDLLK